MTALSSIGLILCPSSSYFDGNSNNNNDENNKRSTSFLNSYNIMSSPSNSGNTYTIVRNGEKEIKLNVILSTTIHHNITINSPLDEETIADASSLMAENLKNATKTNEWISRSVMDALNLTQTKANVLNNTMESQKHFKLRSVPKNEAMIAGENYTGFFMDPTLRNEYYTTDCAHPEYIVFTWILCLVSLATALKLYYLVKVIMAICMVAFYTTLIQLVFPLIYPKDLIDLEQSRLGMPLGIQMLILLISFLIMVCYHARLVEVSFFRLIPFEN